MSILLLIHNKLPKDCLKLARLQKCRVMCIVLSQPVRKVTTNNGQGSDFAEYYDHSGADLWLLGITGHHFLILSY